MNIFYILYSLVFFYYITSIKFFFEWFLNNLNLNFLIIANIRIYLFIIKNNEYFLIILLFIIIFFSPIIFGIWILHHLYIAGIHIINDYIFNQNINIFLKFIWLIINFYTLLQFCNINLLIC